MSSLAGDAMSRKFKKLTGQEKKKKPKQTSFDFREEVTKEETSSDFLDTGMQHRRRMAQPVAPSSKLKGPGSTPKQNKYFPKGSEAASFDPLLAVYIARLMPIYWSDAYKYERLMELAKLDAAQIQRGKSDVMVKARMTVVMDRLHALSGSEGLSKVNKDVGFHELRFVKDVMRLRHLAAAVERMGK